MTIFTLQLTRGFKCNNPLKFVRCKNRGREKQLQILRRYELRNASKHKAEEAKRCCKNPSVRIGKIHRETPATKS